MEREASARWQGGLTDGQGHLSSHSGILSDTPYSFGTRFKDQPGTNPEELIAAAHAGCFSMALALELGQRKLTPENIETHAAVTLEQQNGDWAVTRIRLQTEARVPNAGRETFEQAANAAKEGCPVSKLLNAQITLDAKLLS